MDYVCIGKGFMIERVKYYDFSMHALSYIIVQQQKLVVVIIQESITIPIVLTYCLFFALVYLYIYLYALLLIRCQTTFTNAYCVRSL